MCKHKEISAFIDDVISEMDAHESGSISRQGVVEDVFRVFCESGSYTYEINACDRKKKSPICLEGEEAYLKYLKLKKYNTQDF